MTTHKNEAERIAILMKTPDQVREGMTGMSEGSEPVRRREAQIIDLGARIFVGMRNHTDSMCEAQRHIDEAEARGAEEQRQKDAGEEKDLADWIFKNLVWAFGREDYTFIKVGDSLPDNCMATLGDLIDNHGLRMIEPKTGKAEIANVAALEARVKELEGERDALKKQIQAINPGSARPVIHSPTRFMDDSRAALTREGGV